jgi:hypothetical protein
MAFAYRLEHEDGTLANPPTFRTAVPNWQAGDVIPLGGRSLRVVEVRNDGADQAPTLVVEEVAKRSRFEWDPRKEVTLLSVETFMDGLSAARRAGRLSEDCYDQVTHLAWLCMKPSGSPILSAIPTTTHSRTWEMSTKPYSGLFSNSGC